MLISTPTPNPFPVEEKGEYSSPFVMSWFDSDENGTEMQRNNCKKVTLLQYERNSDFFKTFF